MIVVIVSLIWGVMLSWFDLQWRRLPNWLTVGGALTALAVRWASGGWMSVSNGLAAGAVSAAVLLLPFLMRGAGGGDVKMLFAAGAIAGWQRMPVMLIICAFAGLILGVVMLIFGRLDSSRLKHYTRCAWDWRYDRKAGAAALPSGESPAVRVPFSLAITVGLIWALLV